MEKNIPLYEMFLENEFEEGVFAVSIVDSPAISQNFILLNEEKQHIDINLEKVSDEKRKVLTGPILIPDLVIARADYNIVFSKETVRKASENYIIKNKDSVDLQHSKVVNDVYLIESWIVDDEDNDKIYALGYTKEQVPLGSWVGSFKIIDDNLWTEYLKSGVLKGFSIAGSFTQKEVKLEEQSEYEQLYDLYLAVNFTAKDLNTKYKWILGDAKEDACPACLGFNGKTKLLKDWMKLAVPRAKTGVELGTTGLKTSFPHSPYSTFCEDKCKCRLVKVKESKHGVSVIKPF